MSREPRAFPRQADAADARGSDGMSLRDYYAGRAMQALIVRSERDGDIDEVIKRTAETAFKIAAAMMKARGQ